MFNKNIITRAQNRGHPHYNDSSEVSFYLGYYSSTQKKNLPEEAVVWSAPSGSGLHLDNFPCEGVTHKAISRASQ